MSDAMIAIGKGIGNAANLNAKAEITTSEELLSFMGMYATLSSSWASTLSIDQTNYEAEALATITTPSAAAGAAADYAKYEQDEASQATDTSNVKNLVSHQESLLQTQGASMENIYNLALPVGEMLEFSAGLQRS